MPGMHVSRAMAAATPLSIITALGVPAMMKCAREIALTLRYR